MKIVTGVKTSNLNDKTSEEPPTSLEEYVNAHVPEQFRYWLLHQRGYADRFNWLRADRERGKREKERRIVDQWAAARYRERNACPYVQIESCAPPLPDCQLVDRVGQKIGVEVTELVDQATVEQNRYASYHWKEYSADGLFSATLRELLKKNRTFQAASAAIRKAGFRRMVVILHCDEPDLRSRPAFCREVFSSRHFPRLSEIDEAFLLLPCPRKRNLNDFEAEFCQPIRIPLPTRDSQ